MCGSLRIIRGCLSPVTLYIPTVRNLLQCHSNPFWFSPSWSVLRIVILGTQPRRVANYYFSGSFCYFNSCRNLAGEMIPAAFTCQEKLPCEISACQAAFKNTQALPEKSWQLCHHEAWKKKKPTFFFLYSEVKLLLSWWNQRCLARLGDMSRRKNHNVFSPSAEVYIFARLEMNAYGE